MWAGRLSGNGVDFLSRSRSLRHFWSLLTSSSACLDHRALTWIPRAKCSGIRSSESIGRAEWRQGELLAFGGWRAVRDHVWKGPDEIVSGKPKQLKELKSGILSDEQFNE